MHLPRSCFWRHWALRIAGQRSQKSRREGFRVRHPQGHRRCSAQTSQWRARLARQDDGRLPQHGPRWSQEPSASSPSRRAEVSVCRSNKRHGRICHLSAVGYVEPEFSVCREDPSLATFLRPRPAFETVPRVPCLRRRKSQNDWRPWLILPGSILRCPRVRQ